MIATAIPPAEYRNRPTAPAVVAGDLLWISLRPISKGADVILPWVKVNGDKGTCLFIVWVGVLVQQKSGNSPSRARAPDGSGVIAPETMKERGESSFEISRTVERFIGSASTPYLTVVARRPIWRLKRIFDALGSAALIVALSPLIAIVGLLVLLDAGLPITFWQRRSGAGGRPFKLYKFRTLMAAHDCQGQFLTDDQRASCIGRFLRRSRLDNLPQLFSILRGEMSFVGPQPILSVDEPLGINARISVAPGLTGMTQVSVGREASPEDKTALDAWYVRNASARLDTAILLKAVVKVIVGARRNEIAIRRARLEMWGAAPIRSNCYR